MPNTISADPRTTRSQDSQAGGDLCIPPNAPDPSTNSAVSVASPNSQPARNARLLGRGRGACNTSTAGMIVNGEIAVTSANGVSAPRTEPKLAVTGSIFAQDGKLVVF